MNENLSPSAAESRSLSTERREKKEDTKEKDGASSGGDDRSRAALQEKLVVFYKKLDDVRNQVKVNSTPGAKAATDVLRTIDLDFNAFVEQYRITNRQIPAYNPEKAAALNTQIDDFLERVSAVPTSPERPKEGKKDMANEEREPTREEDVQSRYESIRSSIAIRLQGVDGNKKSTERDLASQNFFKRLGSNTGSMLEQNESYRRQILEVQTNFDTLWKSAKTVEAKEAVLRSVGKELSKATPDFKKLRGEFERTQKILDATEQGLQYAQTALEIAASYAGPPGIAASLIPKYVVELSTGQSTPQNVALRILEDVISAYIGSGKVAKALFTKLGPVGKRLAQVFESANASGWSSKTAVKKVLIDVLEVFRDTGLQNAFAEAKEFVTGEEANRATLAETATGKVIGKVIGKGLEKTGVKAKIESTAKPDIVSNEVTLEMKKNKATTTTETTDGAKKTSAKAAIETPAGSDKVAIVADFHIGEKNASNRFLAVSKKLREKKEANEGAQSIIDMGDFLEKVGDQFKGKRPTYKEKAEVIARLRSKLARSAGVDPDKYFVVTGNHDIPDTVPVTTADGKPVVRKKESSNFSEAEAKLLSSNPEIQEALQHFGEKRATPDQVADVLDRRSELVSKAKSEKPKLSSAEADALVQTDRGITKKLKEGTPLSTEESVSFENDVKIRKKLVDGQPLTEGEKVRVDDTNTAFLRKLVDLKPSEADIQTWKDAHEKYGLRLVTSSPDERWIGEIPGLPGKTVLRHFPANDGPVAQDIVDPKDRHKLEFFKLDAGVRTQIGADIHQGEESIRGENWEDGERLDTIFAPAVGGKIYENGERGILIIDAKRQIESIAFAPDKRADLSQSKALPMRTGASRPAEYQTSKESDATTGKKREEQEKKPRDDKSVVR